MTADPVHGPIDVTDFDVALAADAAAELLPCCASRRWVVEIVDGRPYGTLPALVTESDEALADLDWADVSEALSAHPRIGDRVAGASAEAAWSRGEQSGTADLDADLAQRLVAVNREYEKRFGHVFLICASGLTAAQMIEAAQDRLPNDPQTERAVVAAELRKIVRLRLAKAFH